MGRTLWMARTDLKVPSIFLIFLSKNKPLSLEHRYLEQSNSINGPAGHATHFQVGGENQNVEGGCRGQSKNEFKDFRGQKKYSPEQQKVFLLHAFFQVFLLIFSFTCIYFCFLVHFQFL